MHCFLISDLYYRKCTSTSLLQSITQMVGSVHGEYWGYGECSPVLRECPGLSLLSPSLLLLWSDGQGRFPSPLYIICAWPIGYTYLYFLSMVRINERICFKPFVGSRYL